MSRNERRLLYALAWMSEQYIRGRGVDRLDHGHMHAGEHAVEMLVEYGLVNPSHRGGTWTTAGRALLDATPPD